MRTLTPTKGMHLKDIWTGEMYEGTIYLGIYDSSINYVQVTETDYQNWLKSQQTGSESDEDQRTGSSINNI